MVVDDEPGILRLCSRLLNRAGFRVITTADPEEAASFLENEMFDLLLVDIRMPEMDGFQLIERARSHTLDLAVVVMTGFGTVETAINALSKGADELVLKPFTSEELVQSVRRALQNSQQKQDVLRLQTLRPLFAITESLFTETNPARLQDLVLDTVCGHLRCTHAGLYKRIPGDRFYSLTVSRGNLPAEELANPELSLVTRADLWGQALSSDTESDRLGEGRAVLESLGLSSMIAAPLQAVSASKEGASVLVAARSSGEAIFRESDLETIAILARQAAVAFENARLHEELREYLRRVEDSQQALIRAEKMATAGRLTASIAHEINNPLQSVQNCLHLAGRKELDADVRENYLEMAQGELERLINTVQRMLDYYRPGALDRKPVDLNYLIRWVLNLLEGQISQRQVQVQLDLAEDLPHLLIVSDQIQQVLLNLILNSLEAMPAGGTLSIQTGENDGRLEIQVEDSGPGIDVTQRSSIFEPFVSSKEGGTGLGLAVSYGIIAAHGGSLDLVDGRSQGACFKISLPLGGTK
jgi:two-component system, NtrC family, sensor kinase